MHYLNYIQNHTEQKHEIVHFKALFNVFYKNDCIFAYKRAV